MHHKATTKHASLAFPSSQHKHLLLPLLITQRRLLSHSKTNPGTFHTLFFSFFLPFFTFFGCICFLNHKIKLHLLFFIIFIFWIMWWFFFDSWVTVVLQRNCSGWMWNSSQGLNFTFLFVYLFIYLWDLLTYSHLFKKKNTLLQLKIC